MAIISNDEVKNLAISGHDEWIGIARNDAKALILHYYGIGTDEHLEQISGLENPDQLKLRKKHAISNEFLTENLLRAIDNIWNAKGGSVKIDLPDNLKDDFKKKLDNVGKGYSIKEYVKEVWKDKLIADPNGITFVEVTKDGSEAYLTQKSIFSIKNMRVNGTKADYICFEPHEVIEEKRIDNKESVKKIVWVVDDAMFYEVEVIEDTATILQEIPNPFKRVPARLNSPMIDTMRNIKVSPIQKQVKLLGAYLNNNSIKEIYQFLHGYPVFWMYTKKCPTCDGSGFVNGDTCTACSGTGHNAKKDISDVIALKTPTEDGQPVIAPDVAGYVQPDLETWREQRDELDWKYSLIYYSHWGTTTESGENETATGRFIDTQPVNNKLNVYADMAEDVHSDYIELLGTFYYSESYKGSNVNYGRRFLIESPDQVWKKYLEAKKEKAPISALDQLLEQYYESEYQRNELMQSYYLRLIKIEPYVHLSIGETVKLPISELEKSKKIHFGDWLKTKMINEITDKKPEDLIKDLEVYSQLKIDSNVTKQTTSETPGETEGES